MKDKDSFKNLTDFDCPKCCAKMYSNEGDTGGVDAMLKCSRCGYIENYADGTQTKFNWKNPRVSLKEWVSDRDELWEYIYELEALLNEDQKVYLYRKGIISIGKLSELLHKPYEEVFSRYYKGWKS